MKKYLAPILLIIITAAATFFVTKKTIKPEQIYTPGKDIVKAETTYVYKDKPYYVNLPGKIDTIRSLTNEILHVVANADTVIVQDSAVIEISYFFPPENFFNVKMNIKERIKTIEKEITKFVEIENPWYDTYWAGALSVLVFALSLIIIF